MIADFHNDILTAKSLPFEKELQGLDCGVLALYKGNRSFSDLFSIAEKFYSENKDKRFFLAFEELSGIGDCELDTLISLRPKYVTLTWNWENDLAHGCKSSGGLKKKGKKVIKACTEHGIYIDTAHLCRQSFLEVCNETDYVVNSHTCFSALRSHARNIDDEQIKILYDKHAPIGITFVGAFLTDTKATSDHVVRHVDHYVQKYGCDRIAIGSDYYGTQDLPQDLLNYKTWDILVEKFLKIGYNIEVIEKILYRNLKIFLYGS